MSPTILLVLASLGAPAAPADAPPPVRWDLRPGDAFKVTWKAHKALQRVRAGNENKTDADLSVDFRFKVLRRTAEKGFVLDVRFESVNMGVAAAGGRSVQEALKDKTVRVTLDDHLNVVRIDGFDVISRQVMPDAHPFQQAASAHQATLMCRCWLEDVFVKLPAGGTRPGEKWTEDIDPHRELTIHWARQRHYTDEGVVKDGGRELRKFSIKASAGKPQPVVLAGAWPAPETKETVYDGTLHFDPAGVLARSEFKSRIKRVWERTPDGQPADLSETEEETRSVVLSDLKRGEAGADEAPEPARAVTHKPALSVSATGIKLALVPAGKFQMGSSTGEVGRNVNETQHAVELTRAFRMGVHEVTVAQFRRFVEATDYKTEAERDPRGGHGYNAKENKFETAVGYSWKKPGYPQGDDHPVVVVSYNDAVAYCEWLSKKEGKKYRLPTEAEWEYACRAGATTRYQRGDAQGSLASLANVCDETTCKQFPDWQSAGFSDGQLYTAPVGSYKANAFGLHDLHGNVQEWCADYYGNYSGKEETNPTGPSFGFERITRGGSFADFPVDIRCARRMAFVPQARFAGVGFRVVTDAE